MSKEKLGNMRFEKTKRGTGNMSARPREEVVKAVVKSGSHCGGRLRWDFHKNLAP